MSMHPGKLMSDVYACVIVLWGRLFKNLIFKSEQGNEQVWLQ